MKSTDSLDIASPMLTIYAADSRVQQLRKPIDEDETEMERLVEQFQMVGAQLSGV